MKKILSLSVLVLVFLISSNIASAHGVLTSQEQTVGKYKVSFQATADASVLYEGYAITYMFNLQDAQGKDVSYDYALIDFSKKDGALIARAQTDGPRDFIPGAMMDIAMPSVGDYTAEVIFVKELNNGDTDELAKASFDFSAKENPSIASKPSETGQSDTPVYVWLLGALVVGVVFGAFGKPLLKKVFSN